MGIEKVVTPEEAFLEDLKQEVKDGLHLRLLNAYALPDPVGSMEKELGAILLEVVRSENQ